MLFSELQKKVSPSPIKTYRLLMRMRDDQRMKEGDDWIMVDRKLYVNVPRFIVELEQMGYAVKSADFKTGDVKSDEITKLIEEVRLLSGEFIDDKIQREMQQPDDESSVQDPQMKSSEINNTSPGSPMKSDEIRHEEPTRKTDGISPEMKSPEINLKSPEFNLLLRSKDEIITSKQDQIDHMKEIYTEILKSKDEMLKSKDEELKEVRTALDTVVKQNETLVHQNVFLTRLLTGPKEERVQHTHDDVISPDYRDITEVSPEHEERAREPEPVATAAHESGASSAHTSVDHRTPSDVPVASDQSAAEPSTPEEHVSQV